MKLEIEIEEYSQEKGLQLKWESGFSIHVQNEDKAVVITGNKAGLISLARHLLTLAQDKVLEGAHIHFDEYNALEDHSLDLIIQKII